MATNIAETSVTIPGIAYVVDGGIHKVLLFLGLHAVECNERDRFGAMIRIVAFLAFNRFRLAEAPLARERAALEGREPGFASDCREREKKKKKDDVCDSRFFRYTEDAFFSELEEEDRSEISRSNIAHVVLTLMTLKVKNVIEWDYLER